MKEEMNRLKTVLERSATALAVVLVLLMFVPDVWAQEPLRTDEVVVTASKLAEPREEATSEVIVITAEEIERSGAEFLPEVLRKVTEINIVQNGGPGTSAAAQLRGGNAEHVVIMIDGVKIKSTTLGYYDLSGIKADDIARIEIVKGPQSSMYGSEAMAGVINIITKRSKPGFTVGGGYEAGTFNTRSADAFIGGGSENWSFRLSGSKYRTDGISIYPDGDEEDGYESDAYSAKAGLVLAQNLTVDLSRRYYKDKSDLDYGGSFASLVDDEHYTSEGTHNLDIGKATLYLIDNWEQILTVSEAKDFIETEDRGFPGNHSEITTEIDTIDWQHNLYLQKNDVLTLGFEKRDESGENEGVFDESVTNKAAYINLKHTNENVTLALGARYDDHETFGDETTYRIGIIEKVAANARFRASYGTGFHAPTLNQLFYMDAFGNRGNPDLDPEFSTSWELGFEQDLGDIGLFSITYFEQKYRDLIEWAEYAAFQYEPQNVSKAKVKGVETTLEYNGPAWTAKASHTHLETEDDDGNLLPRRPKDKYFALLGYYGASFEVSADYTYVGRRVEYDFTGATIVLDPYQLVNVNAAVKLGKTVKLYARGENVTDEDYELADGFNTPGEAYYAGVRVEF